MKKYSVGILGATGMVGQRFVTLLENHPWFQIKVLAASKNSAGMAYKDAVNGRWFMPIAIPENIENMIVLDAENDIDKIVSMVDFVFCAVNMKKEQIVALEEKYAKLECPVISNNSACRYFSDVPMILPEINPEHIEIIPSQKKRLGTKRGFIAVKPNCSLQSFVPAINPLLDLEVEKVLACTYQAISGAGKTFETWPKMIDNLIPYIGGEEEKSELEPLKIWGHIENNKIINAIHPKITTQCFRVPVSNGHTAAVFVSFNKKTSLDEIKFRWQNYKSTVQELNLPSAPKQFLTYFEDNARPQIKLDRNIENGMGISIGRLREDSQYDIKFVCMSHNTIRGAAGGAILMAELLCAKKYI
ncbi:MAG: Aspartate-semialdehyde dehydrogenase [Eubacteriales bacterium SKADARSKE-1]|nr:Aspartate-semialdehyde dehydrogenase [Eubacteriales bacterium SKADARSKE-1]